MEIKYDMMIEYKHINKQKWLDRLWICITEVSGQWFAMQQEAKKQQMLTIAEKIVRVLLHRHRMIIEIM